MLIVLRSLLRRRPAGCTCARRWLDVAHDVSCRVHGAPEIAARIANR